MVTLGLPVGVQVLAGANLVVYPDGRTRFGVPGGAALYAALGADANSMAKPWSAGPLLAIKTLHSVCLHLSKRWRGKRPTLQPSPRVRSC